MCATILWVSMVSSVCALMVYPGGGRSGGRAGRGGLYRTASGAADSSSGGGGRGGGAGARKSDDVELGRAAQVDPMKPNLKPPGTKRLSL